MTQLYPLRFAPLYKTAIWGGRRFETVLGRELGPEPTYSESWEISDHPHGRSVVQIGPLAGASLGELTAARTPELLGPDHSGPRFPLLLKYLDARRRLSVQVHPDDDLATRLGLDDTGKAEAWLVLEADQESLIWAGFNRSVDRQSVWAAIREGDIERVLHRFKPSPGDCLFLPAGTVHALGKGVLVAEIQQASDATFRLFDWNRLDHHGNARALHVERALQAVNYDQGPVTPSPARRTDRPWVERLVESPQFILDRLNLDSHQLVGDGSACHVITVLGGSVSVDGDIGAEPLKFGQTILLPACLGPVGVKPTGDNPAVLLDAYLP
jgi:mannose-6-phosphate isomerase